MEMKEFKDRLEMFDKNDLMELRYVTCFKPAEQYPDGFLDYTIAVANVIFVTYEIDAKRKYIRIGDTGLKIPVGSVYAIEKRGTLDDIYKDYDKALTATDEEGVVWGTYIHPV